jgi:uncharacterized membrane protein YraQ (UPF0718 family)/regulator of protease activity HflC (stomatin/prohibitin superfamily)
MSLAVEFFSQVYWLFKESAPYMILGILIAGFLRFILSEKRFIHAFGKDNLGSVTRASLLGIPLPLCSCSVLPVAISLRQRGASKGATTSFLISTPETGVDSISITYALLDPIFTVARPVAALLSAMITGSFVNLFVRRGWDRENGSQEKDQETNTNENTNSSCCCEKNSEPTDEGPLYRRAARYGFVDLMDTLTPLLLLAFLGSGVIAVLVPDSFFKNPVTQGWSGMFLMLMVGIPFYVCATSSTPIVAALLMKGLSPGAALVFLLAGPATNLGTILAVWGYLGRRVMVIYLFSMAGLTLLFGGMVDSIYRDYGIPVEAIVGKSAHFMPESIKVIAFVFLLILMIASARRTRLLSRWGEKLRAWCKPFHFDPLGSRAKAVFAALLILLYLSTGLSVVDVGEVGWILTFGKVERDASGRVVTHDPGLCYHFPYPFQTMRTGDAETVQTLAFGYRTTAQGKATEPPGNNLSANQDLIAEAKVMNGEESLVSLRFSVQYRPKDPYAYYFRFEEPNDLIRAYAGASVRTVCARRSTQDILVGHRRELEEASRALLQSELDKIGCGVEVLRFSFVDVHAPPEAHFAFRDVASAAEDKHKEELKGEGVYLETLAEARGRAFRIEEEAQSQSHFKRQEALGKAEAFQGRALAYRAWRDLTRLRMYLESMEHILGEKKTVILPLHEGIDVKLWLRSPTEAGPPFIEEEMEKQGHQDEDADRGKAKEDLTQKPKPPDWNRLFRRR